MKTPASVLSHGAFLALALIPAALPAAAATDKPASCSVRDAAAAIRTVVPPERSQVAVQAGLSGSAVVRIELDANGRAHNPAILKSSGSGIVDADALRAALAQVYTPEIRACEPIAGTYRIVVDFRDDDEADRM